MSNQTQSNFMPMKILVIGDFSGSGAKNILHTSINKENFYEIIENISPRFSTNVSNKLASVKKELNIDVTFKSVEDFHPDNISSQVEPIKKAIEARKTLVNLSENRCSFSDVKAELEKLSEEGSIIKDIITGLSEQTYTDVANKAISKLDKALSEQLDEIFHNPIFQQIEAIWRGLELLVNFDDKVRFEILNVKQPEILEQFEQNIFQKEYYDECEVPLSLILCGFEFANKADDMNIIQNISEKASFLQVAFIASLKPEFFGMRNIVHLLALPNLSNQLASPIHTSWKNFINSDLSRWASFTMNRFLLRPLYGSENNQIKTFNYKENADPSHPERYLWGNPIWLAGYVLARSFVNNGTCLSISGLGLGGEYEGLATKEYPISTNEKVNIPVEVPMTDDKVWSFINAGVSPLNCYPNSNIAYFPLFVNAYRSGGVTLHSTLSYHLYIGHIFHQYYRIHQRIPKGSKPDEIISFVKDNIYKLIEPYGGESPDKTVNVDVTSSADSPNIYTISIHVRPELKIESKDVEFSFQLQAEV